MDQETKDFLAVKLEDPTSSSEEDAGRDSTPFEILQIVQEYYRDHRGHLIVPKHKEGKTNSTETRYGAGLVIYNKTMYRPNYCSLRTSVTTARCLECNGTIYISPEGVVSLKKECTPHSSSNPFSEKRKGNYSKVLGPDAKIVRKNQNESNFFGNFESFPPKIDWESLKHHLIPIIDNSSTFESDNFLSIGFSNPESIDKIGSVESANFDVVGNGGSDGQNLTLILSSKSKLLAVFLLSTGSEPNFLKIFTNLQKLNNFNPTRICLSLNQNCRNALKSVFPSAIIRFCQKSFADEIWRQIGGLSPNDAPPMALVQKFVSLAFVNLWNLDEYFGHLEEHAVKVCPGLKDFCSWFSATFITEYAEFSRDEWNCWARVFENLPITNGIDHQNVRNHFKTDDSIESFLKTQWFGISIESENSLIFRLPVFRQATCHRYSSPVQFFESVPPMLLR